MSEVYKLSINDQTVLIDEESNLLESIQNANIMVETYCGGNGQCGKCRVVLLDEAGQALDDASVLVNPKTSAEQAYIKQGALDDSERLACCVSVYGDLSVKIPYSNQAQIVSKAMQQEEFSTEKTTFTVDVYVPKSSLYDQSGEAELLKKALWYEYKLTDLDISFTSIQKLPQALLEKDRVLSVVIRGQKIIDIHPQISDLKIYGIAFDIGSTTIAANLLCLDSGKLIGSKGVMNPQICFGDDVMSRVSYAMMNPDGLPQMNQVLIEAINQVILEIAADAGVLIEHIYETVFVANPIIHHLLLNFDPIPLGQTPFSLATDSAICLPACDLGIDVLGNACEAYVLPCIAGHVGADAAAVFLATTYKDYLENTLVVDIGTNAEIILITKDKTFACSSPTGPAFEGAQIQCGQRAAIGAIEKVSIDRESYAPRFKIIGCDLWSDDPDFSKETSQIKITGICGSGIIDAIAELFLAKIINQDGIFNAALLEQTKHLIQEDRTCSYILYQNEEITILVTQSDIRQIQLAKAALYAGAKLLLEKANIKKLDQIYLAGAFGNHIDVEKAMVLGIIPDCPLEQVLSIGNAASEGAIKALLNVKSRALIEKKVKEVCKIETAIEAKFQDYFVGAMSFPNKTDLFPFLEKSIVLPKPYSIQAAGRRSRRRAR